MSFKENVVSKVFVCPNPDTWNQVYKDLLKVWESAGRKMAKPPIPLILGGWWASSDLQKHTRWNDTVKWAQNNGCAELIPELNSDEKYEVDEMTTVVESYFDDLGEDDSETN